jgi:16S rRNA (uracil1498-N3)-methyltransferase
MQRLVVESGQIRPPWVEFTPEQQHYLGRVLRLTVGDLLIILDGAGQSWQVVLAQAAGAEPSMTRLQAKLLEPVATQTELPLTITLAMALPKGNAFDEVVRQATELGVSGIVPVISDRTLLHPSPHKLERWRRIAQEAAEQSERQRVPDILAPVPLLDYLHTEPGSISAQPQLTQSSYIAVTRRAAPHLADCLREGVPAALQLLIGPEGGWTDAEVERAIAVGYQPVSLGARILRSVTAPIVALTLIAAAAEQHMTGQL